MRYLLAALTLCATQAISQVTPDPIAEARSLLDAGRIKGAETTLREYLKTNPSNADAHFLLGYALFRDQLAKDSLAEFTEGAKFRRPRADELKIVASDYVMLGDYGDADKWFSQVVSEKANDPDAWYLLGRSQYNENEFAAAISSFEHAIALHPRFVEAENNIGLSWKELNNLDKAQAAFETAIEWQGGAPEDAQPFLNLGTLLVEANKFDEAVSYLGKAAKLSPDNPTMHEELGRVYMAQAKYPQAQGELERAVALAPETSALHYKLAQVYRKEGLTERANEEFAICSKLNSAHSSTKTPNPLSLHPAPAPQ
ncbi:MAG TPA: tetratricopeptide repeat protein [Terracidiphilus sp.]|jgi:tetratricopeptide (TPR) repeat protein